MTKRLKSKTYWLAIVTGAIGIIELNAPMLKDLLGDWYGAAFVAIAIASMVLRELTTKPVAEK